VSRPPAVFIFQDSLRRPEPHPPPPTARILQTAKLTQTAWSELVSRLNEASKKKQISLMKAQHRQIAEQLAGLTFQPSISDRSRELAAANRALPERVAALMRKKKAKLDRIRMEREQKELAEATFQPRLNRRSSTAPPGAPEEGAARRIGHLMQ
jgi:hypothetical protein